MTILLRSERGTKKLQTAWRKVVAFHYFRKVKYIAKWNQKMYRGSVGRASFRIFKMDSSAKIIETWWRAQYHRRHFEKQLRTTKMIQCSVRCYWARLVLKRLYLNAKDLEGIKNERDSLRIKCNELKMELAILQKKDEAKLDAVESNAMEIKKKEAATAVTALKESNAAALEKLGKREEESNILMAELKASKEALNNERIKLEDMETRWKQAEAAAASANSAVSKISGELEKCRKETENLKVELDIVQKESIENAMRLEMVQMEKRWKQSEDVSATTKFAISEVSGKMEKCREKTENFKVELEHVKEESTEKTMQVRYKTPNVHSTQNAISTETSEVMERCKKEAKLLRAELGNLAKNASKEIETLKEDFKNAKNALSEMSVALDNANMNRSNSDVEWMEVKSAKAALVTSEEKENLSAEVEELRKALENAKSDAKLEAGRADAALLACEEAFATKEREIKMLQQKLNVRAATSSINTPQSLPFSPMGFGLFSLPTSSFPTTNIDISVASDDSLEDLEELE